MENELYRKINYSEEMSLISNVTSLTNSRLLGVFPLKVKCSISESLYLCPIITLQTYLWHFTLSTKVLSSNANNKYLFDSHIVHTHFKQGDSCIWCAIAKVVEILGTVSSVRLVEAMFQYGMTNVLMIFIVLASNFTLRFIGWCLKYFLRTIRLN